MKTKYTVQEKKWSGEFGKKYTLRHVYKPEDLDKLYTKYFGVSRTELNKEFLGKLDRSIKILEVGSNIGNQLVSLQKIGFKNLYGIEINKEAIEISKSVTKDINFVWGSALDIPFKDNYFDLVFTSGVLIHISPSDIKKVIREIHRVTKQYIWGLEYYADKYEEVVYRGKKNMLWKTNFPKLYIDLFPNLKLVKEKKVQYLDSENVDKMFLFKKKK